MGIPFLFSFPVCFKMQWFANSSSKIDEFRKNLVTQFLLLVVETDLILGDLWCCNDDNQCNNLVPPSRSAGLNFPNRA